MKSYYEEYLSAKLVDSLFVNSVRPVVNDAGIEILPLEQAGVDADGQTDLHARLNDDARTAQVAARKFESPEALAYVAHCFREVHLELDQVLASRTDDRRWIDDAITSSSVPSCMGPTPGPLGQKRADGDNHVPFGPLDSRHSDSYRSGKGRKQVAPLPEHLKGPHITLFGPADGTSMCAEAMNCVETRAADEPAVVEQLISQGLRDGVVPMWGADDEDSRTPLRTGILASLENVVASLDGSLDQKLVDPSRRSKPIRRIPGLAIPCHWLRVDGQVVPLHLLTLTLHLFHAWKLGERALTFYVPKLETERECAYLASLIRVAEEALPSSYKRGSVRIIVVLETARAVFRVNDMMDALYPYFAGMSLGWHDYVAAAARLFRNDPAYCMPAKADASIVFKHIRESHLLLANVVKARGGVAIGGMYGVLPVIAGQSVRSDAMQVCVRGIIRDIIVQMGRGLDGIWVAHSEFVRIAMAVVLAHRAGKKQMEQVIRALVADSKAADELVALSAQNHAAAAGLDPNSPTYPRSLLAAELGGVGATIKNNSEEEVRYNTFQAIQYLTDWLRGNACVALPAELPHPSGRSGLSVTVRVLDDLATTERSRWEVALEIYHGRLSLEDAVRIAREEMLFFRTGGKVSGAHGTTRIAAVPWDDVWSPVAYRIWLLLISPPRPKVVEFVPELLLPFTVSGLRLKSHDIWEAVQRSNPEKYALLPQVKLLDALYAACFSPAAVREVQTYGYLKSPVPARELRAALTSAQTMQLMDPIPLLPVRDGEQLLETFNGRVKAVVAWSSGVKALAPRGRWMLSAQRSNAAGGGRYFKAGESTLDPVRDRVQVMSLSKPIGSAFALEYFAQKGIPLSTGAAALLRRLGSPFVLESAPGCPPEWAEEVTLEMLMCHSSGLSQHYVHSFAGGVPPLIRVLKGCVADLGGEYKPVQVLRKPGTTFAYSGGAFVLLQYLLETLEGKSINEIMAPFLAALGMQSAARMQDDGSGPLVPGVADDGTLVERRSFPGVAAGCVCAPNDMLSFLHHLVRAFDPKNAVRGSGPISHATACRMLGTARREISYSSREFMATDVGTGIFIGECGDNRIAIHQGANEGYRGLFVACYAGPAAGAIITCFAAWDASSIPTIAKVAREELLGLGVLSQDLYNSLLNAKFSAEGLSQEVIVNQGLKTLLFRAFQRKPLPPPPRRSLQPHQWAAYDRLLGSEIVYVSNDTFANGPNLITPAEPDFDPRHFGPEGKTMDSWESVRHNPLDRDILDLKLKAPSCLVYAEISTKWHDGNQVPAVSLEAKAAATDEWVQILPVSPLIGHGMHRYILGDKQTVFQYVRINIHPDGGLSRVRLYDEALPEEAKRLFPHDAQRFPDEIPAIEKATSLYLDHSAADVTPAVAMKLLRNAAVDVSADAGDEVNVSMGGKIVDVSNQHYGPASAILSPFKPRGMHDGMETRRARGENAMDFVTSELLVALRLKRIEVDFSFFVNNNPVQMTLEVAGEDQQWHVILDKYDVKCFRANVFSMAVPYGLPPIKLVRVKAFPCGGFNRLRCFTTIGELRNRLKNAKL